MGCYCCSTSEPVVEEQRQIVVYTKGVSLRQNGTGMGRFDDMFCVQLTIVSSELKEEEKQLKLCKLGRPHEVRGLLTLRAED